MIEKYCFDDAVANFVAGPLKALYLNTKVLFKFYKRYHNVGFFFHTVKKHIFFFFFFFRIYAIKSCLPLNKSSHLFITNVLTLCILETPKRVLLQTVKTQMKC